MYSVKALLAAAGDIPEGIKALLRQTQGKGDRQDLEDGIEDFDTFTLNAAIEDGLITFVIDVEDEDGE